METKESKISETVIVSSDTLISTSLDIVTPSPAIVPLLNPICNTMTFYPEFDFRPELVDTLRLYGMFTPFFRYIFYFV